MGSEDDLRRIGLTKYEANAYLSIVRHNSVDAKTICKEAEVPYGKIYETLNTLLKMNFIEVQNTRPKKYRATKPSLAFDYFYSEKKKSLESDLLKTKELLDRLGEDLSGRSKIASSENTFWKVAFKEDMTKMILESFDNVDKEVNVFIEESYQSGGLDDFTDLIKALVLKSPSIIRRGITLRVLKGKSKSDYLSKKINEANSHLSTFNIIRETSQDISESFMIFDNETIIMRITNPLKKNELLALIKVWNPALAKNLNQKFLSLWGK